MAINSVDELLITLKKINNEKFNALSAMDLFNEAHNYITDHKAQISTRDKEVLYTEMSRLAVFITQSYSVGSPMYELYKREAARYATAIKVLRDTPTLKAVNTAQNDKEKASNVKVDEKVKKQNDSMEQKIQAQIIQLQKNMETTSNPARASLYAKIISDLTAAIAAVQNKKFEEANNIVNNLRNTLANEDFQKNAARNPNVIARTFNKISPIAIKTRMKEAMFNLYQELNKLSATPFRNFEYVIRGKEQLQNSFLQYVQPQAPLINKCNNIDTQQTFDSVFKNLHEYLQKQGRLNSTISRCATQLYQLKEHIQKNAGIHRYNEKSDYVTRLPDYQNIKLVLAKVLQGKDSQFLQQMFDYHDLKSRPGFKP